MLYSLALKFGCTKIALGHYRDDFIATLLLNQFHAGSLAAMSPRLLSDNGKHTLIRLLVYVEESAIIQYSRLCEYPIICCACPVCGTGDQKRQKMKKLIRSLATDIPGIRRSMLAALGNVHSRHLLNGKQAIAQTETDQD